MRTEISKREHQILEMIWDGMENKEIAGRFGLSIKTIEKERQQLYRLAGVNGTAQVIRWGLT